MAETAVFATSAHEGELPPELVPALENEYRAGAFYQAVVDHLLAGKPFSKAAAAELKHVVSLEKLYTKRLMNPPDPPDTSEVVLVAQGFSEMADACAYAVGLEEEMIAAYDLLLAMTLPDDVTRVIDRLKGATYEKHLPAFEKCAVP